MTETGSRSRYAVLQHKGVYPNIDDYSKAFLRIRPNSDTNDQSATPYLKKLSDATVQMTDPSGSNRIRLHPQAQVYTFNHIFEPETRQSDFFTRTTLPLVRDLLQGQNGLIFTYGVTNSGKTYTIQGGAEKDTAGLLPRTLDVAFNSLEGLHSNAPVSRTITRLFHCSIS